MQKLWESAIFSGHKSCLIEGCELVLSQAVLEAFQLPACVLIWHGHMSCAGDEARRLVGMQIPASAVNEIVAELRHNADAFDANQSRQSDHQAVQVIEVDD